MRTSGLSLEQAPPEDIPFRFFIMAPVYGILAGMLLLWKGLSLFQSQWSLETVSLTHLLTLGWLTMIMMGAFYQMVPVLVGNKVPAIVLARWVHALLNLGIAGLTGGMLWFHRPVLTVAFLCLMLAFVLFLTQIAIALWTVKADKPVVHAMRISVASGSVVVGLGLFMLSRYLGWNTLAFSPSTMRTIHVSWAFTGWIGCLIAGVGFHVIPMFYLTGAFPGRTAHWILTGLAISLILVSICLATESSGWWLALCVLPGIAGFLMFSGKMLEMLFRRKRKIQDSPLLFWQQGLFFLIASCLLVWVAIWNELPQMPLLLGAVFLAGFAMSITQGMLYKIVPFLIWFHRFSSLAGKIKIPLLKDILSDRHARGQWFCYAGFTGLVLPGILFQSSEMIRVAGFLLIISSSFLFINLFKAYRIAQPIVAL
ncbi:MAG: hypothetical protein HQM11_12610 [SAR324 cluster bacterium]|nr:hypothetical protein [SAR324 cluster bacterium]